MEDEVSSHSLVWCDDVECRCSASDTPSSWKVSELRLAERERAVNDSLFGKKLFPFSSVSVLFIS